MLEDIIKNAGCLPKPCKYDFDGKACKNYSLDDWFDKIGEELFEAHSQAVLYDYTKHEKFASFRKDDLAEELADIITVCTSFLDALGYDENARSRIFKLVNMKNKRRGYFGERQ